MPKIYQINKKMIDTEIEIISTEIKSYLKSKMKNIRNNIIICK